MKCKYCSKSYKEKKNLNVHIKIAHEGQSFPCCFCPLKYTTKFRLKKHAEKKHGETKKVIEYKHHRNESTMEDLKIRKIEEQAKRIAILEVENSILHAELNRLKQPCSEDLEINCGGTIGTSAMFQSLQNVEPTESGSIKNLASETAAMLHFAETVDVSIKALEGNNTSLQPLQPLQYIVSAANENDENIVNVFGDANKQFSKIYPAQNYVQLAYEMSDWDDEKIALHFQTFKPSQKVSSQIGTFISKAVFFQFIGVKNSHYYKFFKI